jgi:glycerophosphoryl diester phosphodiesterase
MLIYAHRGASGRLPENTLAALRGAMEDRADGVEIDLHATADGVPVLLHDRDLSVATSGTGVIDGHSLIDLAGIDVGGGQSIPTFADALSLVAGRLRLDVEVKQPGIEAAVLAELRLHSKAEWFVSSFDWDILRRFRALDSGAPLWPLAEHFDDSLLAVAAELVSPGVAIWREAIDERVAKDLSERGLAGAIWTVNDAGDACRIRDLGAAILITDHPAAIRAALSKTA